MAVVGSRQLSQLPHDRVECLAEIREQAFATAARGFGVAEQRIELGAFHAFALVARIGLRYELMDRNDVAKAIAHPRIGT